MKGLLNNTELRFAKNLTGSSDITVMGLADLPEEERKRYEAMGFTVKPVERRIIKQVFPEIQASERVKGKRVRCSRLHMLTVEEYRRLKDEKKSDDVIMRMFDHANPTSFYTWKKENNLIGTRLLNQVDGKKVML